MCICPFNFGEGLLFFWSTLVTTLKMGDWISVYVNTGVGSTGSLFGWSGVPSRIAGRGLYSRGADSHQLDLAAAVLCEGEICTCPPKMNAVRIQAHSRLDQSSSMACAVADHECNDGCSINIGKQEWIRMLCTYVAVIYTTINLFHQTYNSIT